MLVELYVYVYKKKKILIYYELEFFLILVSLIIDVYL